MVVRIFFFSFTGLDWTFVSFSGLRSPFLVIFAFFSSCVPPFFFQVLLDLTFRVCLSFFLSYGWVIFRACSLILLVFRSFFLLVFICS